jgi:hypothetical protein
MLGIPRRGASEKSGAKGSWRYLVPNLLALLAVLVQNTNTGAFWRVGEERRQRLTALPGPQFTCFTRYLVLSLLAFRVLNLLALLRGGEAQRQRLMALPGPQLTRFTGTKVLNYVRAHAS